MAIPAGIRANFDTLIRAAQAGDLALMEGSDKATGEVRYILAAANREPDGGVCFVPFGHLAADNPFDIYKPPEV